MHIVKQPRSAWTWEVELRPSVERFPYFLDYVRREHSGILDTIAETNKFEEDTEKALEDAYDKFLDMFETSDGQSIKVGKEEHEALPEDELEQEQIVKQKRG